MKKLINSQKEMINLATSFTSHLPGKKIIKKGFKKANICIKSVSKKGFKSGFKYGFKLIQERI